MKPGTTRTTNAIARVPRRLQFAILSLPRLRISSDPLPPPGRLPDGATPSKPFPPTWEGLGAEVLPRPSGTSGPASGAPGLGSVSLPFLTSKPGHTVGGWCPAQEGARGGPHLPDPTPKCRADALATP